MTGRVLLTVGLLLLCCAPLGRAEAATTVNTQTLRLTFDGQGNLESAIACFPACSGESVRLQQFADDGLIRIGPRAGGRWAVAENRSADHHELSFTGPDGSRLAWRIPQQGYRLELELATGAGLSIRSGPSFRPREAAGFGNWLEQSRYAIINEEAVRQIGMDEDEPVEVEVDGWLGYRNRYWALMAAPPQPVSARLQSAPQRQDAELAVIVAERATANAVLVDAVPRGPLHAWHQSG